MEYYSNLDSKMSYIKILMHVSNDFKIKLLDVEFFYSFSMRC